MKNTQLGERVRPPKRRVRYVTCPRCKGKGTVNTWVWVTVECSTCQGRKKVAV
jgi:DnaJ-class molecular chaperone